MSAPVPDPSAGPATDPGYLSHRQILVVLGGLMAGMFLAALDQSIIATALPRITSEVGGLDKLSWVVTAYLLTSTASTPLWGKISDLYGRRLIFQVAIVTFLVGSLLCGLAQDIGQLIGFRAVQGLGGGGLMALALATIGDVIPPRERGRYQGYFGAVFGTSSVLGPVLGGWLSEGPGWRWIFFLNIPIGAVALVVTSMALRMPVIRRDRRIDYLGAATVMAAVSCLLLFTAWAGPDVGWLSTPALLLLAGGAVLTAAFVGVELRAEEPILPMELFRQRVFSASNTFGFIIGMAMFGSLTFIPVYLQVVDGMGATQSGLAMIPLVIGIFSTSITAGQLMSRTGRYKIFPILGAITVTAALALLSRLTPETPYWVAAFYMWLLGAGLGFTMQIIVTVVQNSVERRHMGSATSAVTFFRMMGGAFGAALFGAVLQSRLSGYLAERLPAGAAPPGGFAGITDNVEKIKQLPEPLHGFVITAFNDSLSDVFLAAVPIMLVALVVAFFITEVPLKSRDGEAPVEGSAAPSAVPSA